MKRSPCRHNHAGAHALFLPCVETRPTLLSLPDDCPESLPSLGCYIAVLVHAISMRCKSSSGCVSSRRRGVVVHIGPNLDVRAFPWSCDGKPMAKPRPTIQPASIPTSHFHLDPHDTAISLFCSWANVRPSGACRNKTISDCLKYRRASENSQSQLCKCVSAPYLRQ